ncbi:pseudouridine synthase [Lasiosphaeria hispida]|uniref:tRNA pseudouridine(55) synthase n=1 Tax=Lasiosphaeria hispida TaxID=260671 RepID=A0AAJ0MHW2_9PEZI|nr:pseudouridine synthase [Lasiosphaeria hispida]
MAQNTIMEGVFAINKPVGMSSAQVIRDCQNVFNPSNLFAPLIQQEKDARGREPAFQQKRRNKIKREIRVKMGHGGTLDPLATGVLILGVGKGTKSLQDFLNCTKTYETVVLFGASTDTYDRTGRIIKKGNYENVTKSAVEDALKHFRGKFKQMPPLYSALKMEGKPLYEYAREGKPIPREIATRDVTVTDLEIVEWYEPGTHNHRWPAEEAEQDEKALVGSVWRAAKRQTNPELITAEDEEAEAKAQAELQSKKREAEEAAGDAVGEGQSPAKKRKFDRKERGSAPAASGAIGDLLPKGRGSNLIPPPPSPETPPPWGGKGPPAVKIRMTVTSGFYVRSLCFDLGEKLGSGAMMAELVRSRQGDFILGSPNCLEYVDILQKEHVWGPKVESMLLMWMNRTGTPFINGAAGNTIETSKAAENVSAPEVKAEVMDTVPVAQPVEKAPCNEQEEQLEEAVEAESAEKAVT